MKSFAILVVFLASFIFGWPIKGSTRDSLCNLEWPTTGGIWKDEPPYWQLPNCPNQYFSIENTTKCMQNRTLYVIGNSVARQSAFNLVELLGGAGVKREDQKSLCPKHETTWDDSCHQEFAGVKIRYLFMQFMDGFDYSNRSGFPFYRQSYNDSNGDRKIRTGRLPDASPKYGNKPDDFAPGSFWADDNCILEDSRYCFGKFFKNSKKEDVLIFIQGGSYPLPSEEEDLKEKEEVMNGKIQLDMKAWLTSSAVNFRAHLAATFKGTVFRGVVAPMNPSKYLAYLTPQVYRTNELLWTLWQPASEEMPWYTIDQWAINSGREYMYNDHIHFNGPLSHATLYVMLNQLCPGGGDPNKYNKWPRIDLAGKILIRKDSRRRLLEDANNDRREAYFVNSKGEGQPIQLDDKQLIPWYLSENFPQIHMNSAELDNIFFSKEIVPWIPDKTPVMAEGRSVYIIEMRTRHAFGSADAFYRHGFDFDHVLHVSQWLLNLIPIGADMN